MPACRSGREGSGGGFQARTYRQQFSQERSRSFGINYKETNLWIGVDPASFQEEMKEFFFLKVKELRLILEDYELKDPVFGKTIDPHQVEPNAPEIVRLMVEAAMIICRNAALADAFATAFGNRVKPPDDVQAVIDQTEQFPDILSAVIICCDKIGIRGKFEIKLIK